MRRPLHLRTPVDGEKRPPAAPERTEPVLPDWPAGGPRTAFLWFGAGLGAAFVWIGAGLRSAFAWFRTGLHAAFTWVGAGLGSAYAWFREGARAAYLWGRGTARAGTARVQAGARTTANHVHAGAVRVRDGAHAASVRTSNTARAGALRVQAGARTTATHVHAGAVRVQAGAHTAAVRTSNTARAGAARVHAGASAASTRVVAVARSLQRRLPAHTGNPVPVIVAAYALIAGAGIMNLMATLAAVARLPGSDTLPPYLGLLERYGFNASLYGRILAAVDVAYAVVIFGIAMLLASLVRDKRRWARVASAVLAAVALLYCINLGTGWQLAAACLAAAGAAATFTKGAAPWFRPRTLQTGSIRRSS
ncbi:hypothetical protein [Arthrobacter zhangbolii]|uniref:Uncharacterized protein n=1 Tax=Arthrobacter zhangbolii TaxID=2886936 RepID=A0A9X1M6T8_9MICC|nr:hypothetical protein [Arthrobacter zhangbolii]MCC3272523.1 hypothetical protein [Arthrobacter zhangbolii]